MQILLIVSLIFALIAVMFAVQNAATVPVQFLLWKYHAPLALSLLLSVLLGVLISVLFSLPSLTRAKLTIRNLRKKVGELETSLNDAKVKLADSLQKSADLEKKLAEKDLPPVAVQDQPVSSDLNK